MPHPEPARMPDTRRQREDASIFFPCGNCDRCRIDLWAIAYAPDATVVCTHGRLRSCGLCDSPYVEDDERPVAVPVPSDLPLAAE